MQVFIYCKITLHVSGVHRTYHQEYIKLKLPLLVQDISRIRVTTFLQRGQKLGHAGGRLLPGYVICPVPGAAVTVLCTPNDGCYGNPKHVE